MGFKIRSISEKQNRNRKSSLLEIIWPKTKLGQPLIEKEDQKEEQQSSEFCIYEGSFLNIVMHDTSFWPSLLLKVTKKSLTGMSAITCNGKLCLLG